MIRIFGLLLAASMLGGASEMTLSQVTVLVKNKANREPQDRQQ